MIYASLRIALFFSLLFLAPASVTVAVPSAGAATSHCDEPQVVGDMRCTVGESALHILRGASLDHQNFLPLVNRDSCPPFIEDFSDNAGGWQEGALFGFEYGLAGGEYFLRSSGAGFISTVAAPLPCNGETIDLSVSGRWLDEPGAGFGVYFGPTLTATEYYLFDVDPVAGTYRVLQRTPAGLFTFIPDTPTPALEAPPPAILHVRVSDGIGVLSVNGLPVEEFDYVYAGPVQMGLTIALTPDPPVLPIEARFDNVRVYGH